MTSSSSLPPAYPLLNQLLDSALPFPVSSTSSTFILPTVATTSPSSTSSTAVSVIPSVASVTSALSSSPISSSANTSCVNTTASTTSVPPPIPVLSSTSSPTPSINLPFFIHPQDAVATSPHFQQHSAVRQLTRDLQQKKPKHPKRLHLPSEIIQQPVRRLVHSVVYKQKLNKYITALQVYEKHLDELIAQTTFELDKLNNTPPLSKLRKFKTTQPMQLSPLSIQIPPNNCCNYYNCFPSNPLHCSHVPLAYTMHSHFPSPPPSPALIPIRVEPITPTFQPPSPLNDLDPLVTSLNDVD